MPELAEAIFYKNKWSNHWSSGEGINGIHLNSNSLVFRDFHEGFEGIVHISLYGKNLHSAHTYGKQIFFQIGDVYLGIHLGMTGRLSVETVEYQPKKKDAMVLTTSAASYVFSDTRQFGKVILFDQNQWQEYKKKQAPGLLSDAFDLEHLQFCLSRKAKSPIKSALLDQKYFPGIGNYLADEILYHARINPYTRCEVLMSEPKALFKSIKHISEEAITIVAEVGGARDEMTSDFPEQWLFNQRWGSSGLCPITLKPLKKEKIAGRSTVWSPALQG